MQTKNKDTCIVCGMRWSDHGVGGNCLYLPNQHNPDETPQRKSRPRRRTNKENKRK